MDNRRGFFGKLFGGLLVPSLVDVKQEEPVKSEPVEEVVDQSLANFGYFPVRSCTSSGSGGWSLPDTFMSYHEGENIRSGKGKKKKGKKKKKSK